MAINKKLIHFKTKAAFEAQLNNILDTSIVFIQDANLIWTHGTYYCLPSDEVVISNGIEPDKDQDLWIDTSDNTTATFIEEAPIDGKRYVRKNGTWVAILNEVYVGETEPTNGEIIWINPDTDVMKYFDGSQWVIIVGKALPEETLIINLVSNQTNPDSNLNGVIVNVRYSDVDHKQTWAGEALSFKIPYYTTYTISTSSVKGYNAEILESSITASQQTRTITITYTKIANGIYICDNTGALTAVGSWNAANNSSAIGVAVISDNCSFVIEKTVTVSDSNRNWGGTGTEILGIITTQDSSVAKTDYSGETSTTKIINQLGSGNAPAADYCRGRSCTVNGTTLYGYLGALGEWQTAYNNKAAIDSALSKIGGTAMKTAHAHWTSTQWASNDAWSLDWYNGKVYDLNKDNLFYARAFYPLP